jgi:hypothetical protein
MGKCIMLSLWILQCLCSKHNCLPLRETIIRPSIKCEDNDWLPIWVVEASHCWENGGTPFILQCFRKWLWRWWSIKFQWEEEEDEDWFNVLYLGMIFSFSQFSPSMFIFLFVLLCLQYHPYLWLCGIKF